MKTCISILFTLAMVYSLNAQTPILDAGRWEKIRGIYLGTATGSMISDKGAGGTSYLLTVTIFGSADDPRATASWDGYEESPNGKRRVFKGSNPLTVRITAAGVILENNIGAKYVVKDDGTILYGLDQKTTEGTWRDSAILKKRQ